MNSLAQLAGHDPHARRRLTGLLARYRREGLSGLRATMTELVGPDGMPTDEIGTLLVEAVITLAEHDTARTGRRAWTDFDAAEAADEAHAIRRGGNHR